MPAARHIAASHGVDVEQISGSGKDGRITKGDVLAALSSIPNVAIGASGSHSQTLALETSHSSHVFSSSMPTTLTTSSYEDVSNSKMRKIIATRLTESKSSVPHFYTSTKVCLGGVSALRAKFRVQDIKVSVNDLVIAACSKALRDVPEANASSSQLMNKSIDISVAVATPTGLITPIVFKADQLGLTEISSTVRDLAMRAREGSLAPHEYQGGTFSVSNLGMFGISEFGAVINPPQTAILAVGGAEKEFTSLTNVSTKMTARLSADRRVVDEATAALLCQAIRHYLELPSLLIL